MTSFYIAKKFIEKHVPLFVERSRYKGYYTFCSTVLCNMCCVEAECAVYKHSEDNIPMLTLQEVNEIEKTHPEYFV